MLATPVEWIEIRFRGIKKRPHPSSVRRWIEAGELPGKKIGGRWFVDLEAEESQTGNDLADKVLKAG